MPGLDIKKLTKTFDGQTVLDDIDLTVDAGGLLVVLGPSGCGKSTLLRLIAGLESPDRGRIFLDDRDITDLEPQKRGAAMVFQNYALYPHMTVFDNMAFPLKVSRTPRDKMVKIVGDTARLLELDKLLDRRPAQLSGGQRQRVALGRGLVRQPAIFLLDEPLSNLDAALRVKMRQEIVTLQKRLGITMIYVTHDQVEALTMADGMVVLKDGRIRQAGTPEEIYRNPRDSFVASFIGTPAINLFEDEFIDGSLQKLPIRWDRKVPNGIYVIGVRPEHVHIDPNGSITGTIAGTEYIGSVRYLRVQAGETVLTVVVDSASGRHETGQPVRLSVVRDEVFIFDAAGPRLEL